MVDLGLVPGSESRGAGCATIIGSSGGPPPVRRAFRAHRESPAAFVLEFQHRGMVGRQVMVIGNAERCDLCLGEHAIEELDLLWRRGPRSPG